MKNILILTGIVLILFSCTKESTEIIDIIDPIVADNANLYLEDLEGEGRLSELFADDADMVYLQSEAFAFHINHMLEIKQDTDKKKIVLRNLAPLDFENVKVLASFPDIDQEVVILKMDKIKGHTSLVLDYPFDRGVNLFATASGQIIDLSALKGENPKMSFDYDPGDDSSLQKVHAIKSGWRIKFHDFDASDSEDNNWEENMTAHDLRRYTGLMINLAYLFQSPEFKEGVLAENLFGNALEVKTKEEKLDFLEEIFNKAKFNCGKVVKVSGLGGGSTFGVAEHVLNGYLSKQSDIGNVPVHEIAHMLGYSHASNFTYPKKNDQAVNEGLVVVAQRVAKEFFANKSFPVHPDNYYKRADL